jgi:hypothetical protein
MLRLARLRVLLTPASESEKQWTEVGTSGGEPVFEPLAPPVVVGHFCEQVMFDEAPQPGRENVVGDGEPRSEVVEPAHAERRLTKDEQGPPVAQ